MQFLVYRFRGGFSEWPEQAGLNPPRACEDPNGTALLLEPRGDSFAKTYQESVYKAGLPVIVFGTTDIHAEIEKLKKSGVKFRDDLARPEWGLQNLFEDTFGNLIMIQEISIA